MLKYFGFANIENAEMQEAYRGDPSGLVSAVQLANLSRIFIAILIVKCLVIMATGSLIMDTWAKIFTLPILAMTMLFLAVSCYCFEAGKDFLGRMILAGIISVTCIVSVIFCGGFLGSQATPILIFPMVLAFAILPSRQARWFFVGNALIPLAVDLIVRGTGTVLPDFTADTSPYMIEANVMATLFVSVYFCLYHLHKKTSENLPQTPITKPSTEQI